MKKTLVATLIISTSIFLVACNNSTPAKSENNNTSQKTESKITIEKAKDIALKHANLTNDKVTFIKAEEGIDNGVKKYDIEFYSDKTEYDYEINADTGEIIEYDKDVEDYTIPTNPDNKTNKAKITEQEAKDIALKHAKLTSDQVKFDKVEYDSDNGFDKYDIDFYYNNQEYSYEINSQTGEIISHGVEKK
ncbi:PepSY domain-containing protein [Terrisporobacter sp.]|uniref:PepSY domain-containing protein n=1 Tax=Terrisporobacter sp. TaxID=1965305 RepID=UPI0026294E0E|nr:PepSY domain-containing protein [Terrisporobacter sp.]